MVTIIMKNGLQAEQTNPTQEVLLMLSRLLSPFKSINQLLEILVKLLNTLVKMLDNLQKSFAEKITPETVNLVIIVLLIFAAQILAKWLSF